jgi:hypothetical protein
MGEENETRKATYLGEASRETDFEHEAKQRGMLSGTQDIPLTAPSLQIGS